MLLCTAAVDLFLVPDLVGIFFFKFSSASIWTGACPLVKEGEGENPRAHLRTTHNCCAALSISQPRSAAAFIQRRRPRHLACCDDLTFWGCQARFSPARLALIRGRCSFWRSEHCAWCGPLLPPPRPCPFHPSALLKCSYRYNLHKSCMPVCGKGLGVTGLGLRIQGLRLRVDG